MKQTKFLRTPFYSDKKRVDCARRHEQRQAVPLPGMEIVCEPGSAEPNLTACLSCKLSVVVLTSLLAPLPPTPLPASALALPFPLLSTCLSDSYEQEICC